MRLSKSGKYKKRARTWGHPPCPNPTCYNSWIFAMVDCSHYTLYERVPIKPPNIPNPHPPHPGLPSTANSRTTSPWLPKSGPGCGWTMRFVTAGGKGLDTPGPVLVFLSLPSPRSGAFQRPAGPAYRVHHPLPSWPPLEGGGALRGHRPATGPLNTATACLWQHQVISSGWSKEPRRPAQRIEQHIPCSIHTTFVCHGVCSMALGDRKSVV